MTPIKLFIKIPTILGFFLAVVLLCAAGGCNSESNTLFRPGNLSAAHADETSVATPHPLNFVEDYSEALEVSIRDSKPMLVFFTLPNCASSKRMYDTTFCDEEINRLSSRFVCVRIDGAKEGELCRSKGITSFPTILFLNSREQELSRLSGTQTSDQLALHMHVMLQSTAVKVGAIVRK